MAKQKRVNLGNWGAKQAFCEGWDAGSNGEPELTPREISFKYPGFNAGDIDAYAQGSIDGANGDRFRLDFNRDRGD
jgi:hypothetical protein